MDSKPLTRPIIVSAALCCAAVVAWCWLNADEQSPVAAMPARAETTAAPEAASTRMEKPAAMRDASTYAATRLREIKAAPDAWRDVWKWRSEFSMADTPELQREVVALARQTDPDAFLAVLPQALASADDWLRLDAARSIALLPEARLRDGVTIGVAAAAAGTRDEVMDVVAQARVPLRASLLERTLAAAPDVAMRSIALLCEQPSPEFVAVLIDGLRFEDRDIRAAISDAISGIISERFEDHASAARWWTANRDHFDEDMLQTR